MLTDSAISDPLYKEIEPLMAAIGLKTVEVVSSVHQGMRQMRVVVYKEGEEINTDDLSKAYNLIYPRYSIIYGDRDLQLEVSSPGLQRNFKDYMEFSVFRGKSVRVYSVSASSYVTGRIEESDGSSVTLSDYTIEDRNEKGERIVLSFSDIAKAKLEYRWEA